MTTLPYGEWPSPITAQMLATGGNRLGGPVFVGDELWWTEGIAAEGGRQAIVRAGATAGAVETVLPAPWNARSRVHEYGGGSWLAQPTSDGVSVVFVNFADQRVYLMVDGREPQPLTPEGPEVETAHGPSLRWASPTAVTLADGTAEIWWVCEDHTGGADGPRLDADGAPHIERYIAAVPIDGSAAADVSKIRRVTPSARFVAYPRISPDGARLAWISWEHPQMPWDGTELHVAALANGVASAPRTIAGGADISVVQPSWLDADRLFYLSDESGFWNPVVWSAADGAREVLPESAPERGHEFTGPMWLIGSTSTTVLDSDTVLVQHGTASVELSVLDVKTGALTNLHAHPDGDDQQLTAIDGVARSGGALAILAASPTTFPAIYRAQLGGSVLAPLTLVRSSRADAPDAAVLPVPQPIEVPLPGGGVVHAIWMAPRHDGIEAPPETKLPVVVKVHGGPTSQVPAVLQLQAAYYTSRGLGVVEVNYGGSSGYGREYRDRLKGQWGVVDVTDTVAVVDYLVDQGLADPERVGIEGGSAGGWTTLACLTRTDAFKAGASSFGVAELENFVKDTHDFESRYIDGLVGPYPEQKALYVERAPLSHVNELSCPVLLLQGDEDRIVPPSQSEMFRDALAAQGIPHAYLLFEGEQHGFRKAESIIAATEATLSFYGQVFGFEPPNIPKLALSTD